MHGSLVYIPVYKLMYTQDIYIYIYVNPCNRESEAACSYFFRVAGVCESCFNI